MYVYKQHVTKMPCLQTNFTNFSSCSMRGGFIFQYLGPRLPYNLFTFFNKHTTLDNFGRMSPLSEDKNAHLWSFSILSVTSAFDKHSVFSVFKKQ